MRAEAQSVRAVPAAPAGRDGVSPAAAARRTGPELLRAFAHDAAPAGARAAFAPHGSARGGEASRALLLRQLQRTQGNRAVEQWVRRSPASAAVAGAGVSTAGAVTEPAGMPASAYASPPAALSPASAPATPVARATAPAPARNASAASTALVQRDAAADAPWWKVTAFGESLAWQMADQFAPQLAPVLRKGPEGVMGWLETRASGAADAVVDGLMRPVRAVTGAGGQLSAQFVPMLGALQDAGTKIAANDCSPISQAADRIEKTAEKIVGPIVETLQPVVAKVQSLLGAVWDKIGAPIWDWIKDYAGQQWEMVKELAGWIWSLTEPMRSLGADAWTWLKDKLGIGDGPQGENGVLQWLQAKFEAAWQRVKTALAPFTKQIAVVRSALSQVADSIGSGVARVGTLVAQVGKGLGWIAANIGNGQALIAARSHVEKTLLPPLVDGLHRTSAGVTALAASLGGALRNVAAGLDGAAGAVAGSVLRVAASAVQWIAGEAAALAGWAADKLAGVAAGLESAIGKLGAFLHGLIEFLSKVGGVVSDVWRLPMFLAEKVWNWIPRCIRDPVVDFVVPIVLRQIELFEELVRDNDAWQKTKVQVMAIVRLVFVNHDLVGAVKACFNLLLRVLNIPPEMLGKVAAKALAAWDVVSKKPLDFIKNTVRSLGQGFKLLWANIGSHLEHGIEGWLFGELGDKDIHPPKKWSEPKEVFGFAVEVLGLSVGHVAELLKKRIDPKLVDKVQGWIGRFSRAWDWVTHVIDTSKSPAENTRGVIEQAKGFGKSILTGVVEWISGKVATELAVLAAGAAASGGLSEVLDVARRIYKAMLTAKRWAGQILQMASNTLDHVLDIAGGNVAKVGGEFEKIMDKAMPVVIGFLADQVGLGGVGAAIRDIVDALRAQVDAAILWLIDKAKAGIEAVLGGIKAGVYGGTEEEKQARLDKGMTEAVAVIDGMPGDKLPGSLTKTKLTALRLRHRLPVLEAVAQEGRWFVHGEIQRVMQPTTKQVDAAEGKVEEADVPAELRELHREVQYHFFFATAKGRGGAELDVGEFLELRREKGEQGDKWWALYSPTKRRPGTSGIVKLRALVWDKSMRQKAFERAGNPGDVQSVLSKGTGSDGRAAWVHARPLALQGRYSAPRASEPHGWDRLGAKANWVRGHLVNGEMGGPNATWNLVPIPSVMNSRMTDGHENPIRRELQKGLYFFFGADVDYYSDAASPAIGRASDFARCITVSYGETEAVTPDKTVFKDSPAGLKSHRYEIPLPTPEELHPDRIRR